MGSIASALRGSGKNLNSLITGLGQFRDQTEIHYEKEAELLAKRLQAIRTEGSEALSVIERQQAAAEILRGSLDKLQKAEQGSLTKDDLKLVLEAAMTADTVLSTNVHKSDADILQSTMLTIRHACSLHSLGKPIIGLEGTDVTALVASSKTALHSMLTDLETFRNEISRWSQDKAATASHTLRTRLENGPLMRKLAALSQGGFCADELLALGEGFAPSAEIFHSREIRQALKTPDSISAVDPSNPILTIRNEAVADLLEVEKVIKEFRGMLVDLQATPSDGILSFPALEQATNKDGFGNCLDFEKHSAMAANKANITQAAMDLMRDSKELEAETEELTRLQTARSSIPRWNLYRRNENMKAIEDTQDCIHDLVFNKIPESREDLLEALTTPIRERVGINFPDRESEEQEFTASENELRAIESRVLAALIMEKLEGTEQGGKYAQLEIVKRTELAMSLQAAADLATLISLGKEADEDRLAEKLSKNKREYEIVFAGCSAIMSVSDQLGPQAALALKNDPQKLNNIVEALRIAAVGSEAAGNILDSLAEKLDEKKHKLQIIPASDIESTLLKSLQKLIEEKAALSFAKDSIWFFRNFNNAAQTQLNEQTGVALISEKAGFTAVFSEALRNISDSCFKNFAESLRGQPIKLAKGDALLAIEIVPHWENSENAQFGAFEFAINNPPSEEEAGYRTFAVLKNLLPSIEGARATGYGRGLRISSDEPLVIPIIVPNGVELDSNALNRFFTGYCQKLTDAGKNVMSKLPTRVTTPGEFTGFDFKVA